MIAASSVALFNRVHTALTGLLEGAGADPSWGRRTLGAMATAGLHELAASTYAEPTRFQALLEHPDVVVDSSPP